MSLCKIYVSFVGLFCIRDIFLGLLLIIATYDEQGPIESITCAMMIHVL